LPSFVRFLDRAPRQVCTLSLHDALPICDMELEERMAGRERHLRQVGHVPGGHHEAPAVRVGAQPRHEIRDLVDVATAGRRPGAPDRKSTRLNSSHVKSSYAVFCLKKTTR